jgi:diguanylate cyclase (GGDEF)-like protein
MNAMIAKANSRSAAVTPSDLADILAAIGEAAYRWEIASDALAWTANTCRVLNISDPATIANGRAFARLIDRGNAQSRDEAVQSRDEAVMNSGLHDGGSGVFYQVQYVIRPGASVTPYWVEDTGRWFAGPDGSPARAHGTIRVITERRAQLERLSYLSRFDDLTGEMSRRNFTETLGVVIVDAIQFQTSFGFLVVSIDDLARLNEAYGFGVGDEVIAGCARRLRTAMRAGDNLGRISGNKFGIVVRECAGEELAPAAERFLSALRDEPIETATGPVAVTASIGGVVAPRHARSVHQVLSRAHEALSTGKLKRRGGVQVFRPDADRDAQRRENMRASEEIIGALNERRLLAAFEPVVEARSRQPAFHECLMRIRRGDGTLIVANDVMPTAERLGLVRLIDHRMLELALGELGTVADLRLSLNVSPSSASHATWWSALEAALAGARGVAERLTVEITESAAIYDLDEAQRFVARLKDLGCRIAIDDFGAGYTSFCNLRKLGVDIVKIDGGFVKNLTSSPEDQAFVRMVIELARQLGLKTVAEWVQDEAAAAILTGWGCDYLQGAVFGEASVAMVGAHTRPGCAVGQRSSETQ